MGLTRAVQDVDLSTIAVPYGMKLFGSAVNDFSGWSVSDAGDVNGDKIGDIIIGSPFEDPQPGRDNAGVVYVIYGHNTTTPANAGLLQNIDFSLFAGGASIGYRIIGAAAGDQVGISVSGAGDFNGDGLADIIIGANAANPTGARTTAGAAYIVMGSVAWPTNLDLSGLSSQPTRGFKLIGPIAQDNFGISVANAGDINGDGRADIAVGAYLASTNSTRLQSGKAYVVFGRAGPTFADIDIFNALTSPTTLFRILGNQGGDQLGFAVHTAGDFNGDGVSDLIFSAQASKPYARSSAGTSYIIFGRKSATFDDIDTAAWTSSRQLGFRMFGAKSSDGSGRSVSAAGDVNGDGVADIVLGAYQAGYLTRTQCGTVYVLFGRNVSSTALSFGDVDLLNWVTSPSLGFLIFGASTNDKSGIYVSGAGDVNGDGVSDLILGSVYATPALDRTNAGISYIIFGRRVTPGNANAFTDIDLLTDLTASMGYRVLGAVSADGSGCSVSAAGDVNGDNVGDVIIGAYAADYNGKGNTGTSYIVFGTIAPPGPPTVTPSAAPSAPPTVRPSRPTAQPSCQPTSRPSRQPSSQPSSQPTSRPSRQPSSQPSSQPTSQPSEQPTSQPSSQPTSRPSRQPSSQPSSQPTSRPSRQPSSQPSSQPTSQPSEQPTSQPVLRPSSQPTGQPSTRPSMQPTARPSTQPSAQPSSVPSGQPSGKPISQPTRRPSSQPSSVPSSQPSRGPTAQPSAQPSSLPSAQPSTRPSAQPSRVPSAQPSGHPSSQPSRAPSSSPSSRPSAAPSLEPSSQPSMQPTTTPSTQPTLQPTLQPSVRPASDPTVQPSSRPSAQPSLTPSSEPSMLPSSFPSAQPTAQPSSQPTGCPSCQPSVQPSTAPSASPSAVPSAQPSGHPSSLPSDQPSGQPTNVPSLSPSASPTEQLVVKTSSLPSSAPSSQPSRMPSASPSTAPIAQSSAPPSSVPSTRPSITPSSKPTRAPSGQPSVVPNISPSAQPISEPTAAPTAQPSVNSLTGEWAVTITSGQLTEVAKLGAIGSDVWACGDRPIAEDAVCAVLDATSGYLSSSHALPWSAVTALFEVASTDGIVFGARAASVDINEASVVNSVIASCVLGPTEALHCTARSYSGVLFADTVHALYPNKILSVGMYSTYPVVSLLTLSSNTVQSYLYTSPAMQTVTLSQVRSPPSFVGNFVAGACVGSSAARFNYVLLGWVRADNGNLQGMYLSPAGGSSGSAIVNSAELVTGMALEPTGPDTFVVGGMQLSSDTDVSGDGGMHAYLIRANALYSTVQYCVRFRSDSTYSSVHARTLSSQSTPSSVTRGITLIGAHAYVLVDHVQGSDTVFFSILEVSADTGAVVSQAHVYAPTNNTVHCTDMVSTGTYLAILCSVRHISNHTTTVVISTDVALSFSVLPEGFYVTRTNVLYSDAVPFKRTILAFNKQSVSLVSMTEPIESVVDITTMKPTPSPSLHPTTRAPSAQPSSSPSAAPSVSPQPTGRPSTSGPTNTPRPSAVPTARPSAVPSVAATLPPSVRPSVKPSVRPTVKPSVRPSTKPSVMPSVVSTQSPTCKPTRTVTSAPSINPTDLPTTINDTGDASGMDSMRISVVIGASAGGAVCVAALCFILYKRMRNNEKKSKEMFKVTSVAALTSNQQALMYGGYGAGCDGVLYIGSDHISSQSSSVSSSSANSSTDSSKERSYVHTFQISRQCGAHNVENAVRDEGIVANDSKSDSSYSSGNSSGDDSQESSEVSEETSSYETSGSGFSELMREWETRSV